MHRFIDYFSVLSEEEKEYQRSWQKIGMSSDYIHLPPLAGEARGDGGVTLSASPYLADGKQDIHICKHPCFMPPYLHSHEFTEITYAARGEAEENIEGTSFTLKEGDILILNPGCYHTISVFDIKAVIINMIIRKETFERISDQTGCNMDRFSYLVFRNAGKVAEEYIGRIFEEQEEGRSSFRIMQDIYLSALAVELMRQGEPDISKDRRKDRRSIYSVLEYISRNLGSISLASLAEYIELTPQYTSELIKQQAGTTFSSLVRNLKLKEALSLLRDTDKSSKEIAMALGFTPEHFSRVFRQSFTCTPETMRRRLQSR